MRCSACSCLIWCLLQRLVCLELRHSFLLRLLSILPLFSAAFLLGWSISVQPHLSCFFSFFLLPVPFFFLVRNRWKEGVGVLLVATNILVWQALFFPPPLLLPSSASILAGTSHFFSLQALRAFRLMRGGNPRMGSVSGDRRQVSVFRPLSPRSALFTRFACARGPSRHHVLRSDSLLVLPSVVIARPAGRVVKLWSRRHSILMASGTGSLQKSELFRADTAVLWIYRFGQKQQRELASWLEYSRPKHCLLVPGVF